jgi:hypothetical protein
MDARTRTLKRWRRALDIAKILFEDAGYHTAYLEDIEEALDHARIRPEQTGFWVRLTFHHGPLTPTDTARDGVEFITTPGRLREISRRYPCPTAVDVGHGVFGTPAGLLFVDDADGRAVAYAPPALQPKPPVHSQGTNNGSDNFAPQSIAAERCQIRGRQMARALHRVAPTDDRDALLLLQGAVEEGWVTDMEVGLSTRARACAPQRARKVDAVTAADTH